MSFELRRWEHADNYMGENLEDYFVFLSKTRDSDTLEESNFAVAAKRLEEYDGVRIDRFQHWAAGWVKTLMIHENAADALEEAQEMVDELNAYPVLDEEDYSRRETEREKELEEMNPQ